MAFLAPVVSGTALGMCFLRSDLHPLAWVALVPFGWAYRSRSGWVFYLGCFAGAIVCHLLGLDFIRQAYAGTVSTAWITLSVVASLPVVGVIFAVRKLLRRRKLPLSVELPLVWLTIEWVRMHFIALFTEVEFPY